MAVDLRDREVILNELYAENRRLREAPQIRNSTTILVWSIVGLCALAAAFVLALSMIRPRDDNTQLVLIVLGVVVPVITALLAAAVQQVHLAVNSRLSQLLALTAKSSHAEGQLAGLMEPAPGASATISVAHEVGKAEGIEQERTRHEP